MSVAKDPYEALGVARTASDEEIRRAFKTLAKKHHPDVSGGENDNFNSIRAALDLLTNPRSRKLYDDFGILPGDEDSAVRQKALEELGSLFASLLGQVNTDTIAEVDLLGSMRLEVTKRQQTIRENLRRLPAEEAKIVRYQQVVSARLKRKPGGKDIFSSVLETMLARAAAVKKQLESEERVVKAMIEELQNYTSEAETVQTRCSSTSFGGWTVVNGWSV